MRNNTEKKKENKIGIRKAKTETETRRRVMTKKTKMTLIEQESI